MHWESFVLSTTGTVERIHCSWCAEVPSHREEPPSWGNLPLFFETATIVVSALQNILPLAVHSFPSHRLWHTFISIGNDTPLLLLLSPWAPKKLILIERWGEMVRMDGLWLALPDADGPLPLLFLHTEACREGWECYLQLKGKSARLMGRTAPGSRACCKMQIQLKCIKVL